MIVQKIMTTRLVTVEPDDTVSHAASLLRQYQFHHLPVVRTVESPSAEPKTSQRTPPLLRFHGLLTSQDIDLAVALARQEGERDPHARAWQERRVAEIMHLPEVWVNPATSASAAAQLLVERGINGVAVVETERQEAASCPILVGLLTRSDLLLALARFLGAEEPGTQITLPLPAGRMTPLARALFAADELHTGVSGVLVTPATHHLPRNAAVRLCTINPGPWLKRLEQEQVPSLFGEEATVEEEKHV